jgi:NAD-dependent protein deacetylase/lipoamidase
VPEVVIPERLVTSLQRASRVAVITGAGMSAESGIPTFRGAGGLWRSFRPEDLATPQAFDRDPATVWAWYRWRQRLIADAAPNAGHLALAKLQASRPGWRVLTQNVDGLHQRAGSEAVIELHGSIWRTRCTSCGQPGDSKAQYDEGETAPLPRCRCGSLMRPAVVWFGETLDAEVMKTAWAIVEEADAAIVVGTSAVVFPVAALPHAARARNVPVAEINVEETPLTASVTHVVRASAATALPALERLL